MEEQAGGDDARQGLLSSSDHPTGHSSGKDSNSCLDIIHRSIHHLWTSSLLGRVKDLEDESKALQLGEANFCPRSVSKSRRCGLKAAPRALPGSFTQLSLTHQLLPGISPLWASSKPVLPPLSAPNSCDVMYCFPSSNKLHQKKETGIFFLLFSGMEAREQNLCSTVSMPGAHILFMPPYSQLPLSAVE